MEGLDVDTARIGVHLGGIDAPLHKLLSRAQGRHQNEIDSIIVPDHTLPYELLDEPIAGEIPGVLGERRVISALRTTEDVVKRQDFLYR
jgi:hypothetical protein